MVQLTVSYIDRGTLINHTLNPALENVLPLPKAYCGIFQTPWGNANIGFIDAVSVGVDHVTFFYNRQPFRFSFRQTLHLSLKCIEPIPLIRVFSKPLRSTSDTCHVHVFSLSKGVYAGSVSASFDQLSTPLLSLFPVGTTWDDVRFRLLDDNLLLSAPYSFSEIFGSHVGTPNSFVLFFQQTGEAVFWLKNRHTTTEGLTLLCKRIIAQAQSIPDFLKVAEIRRLVLIALSGAIDLSLVKRIGLSESNFEQTIINLRNSLNYSQEEREAALLTFKDPQVGFKRYEVMHGQREAGIWQLFWVQCLHKFFLPYGHIMLEPEWQSVSMFAELEFRRADCAVTVEFGGSRLKFPILLVEAGSETVDPESAHKDFSKLMCMISLCCRATAHWLAIYGRDPKSAKCYGLFVGGQGAKLCVASADVFVHDGVKYIHANVTHFPHLYINMETGIPTGSNCRKPCCQPPLSTSFETIVPATNVLLPDSHLQTGQDYLIPDEPTATASNATGRTRAAHPRACDEAMVALHYFLKGVARSADDLVDAPSPPNDGLPFADFDTSSAFISESRTGATKETPSGSQLADLTSTGSRIGLKKMPGSSGPHQMIVCKEVNNVESELARQLSALNCCIFPRLFDCQIVDGKYGGQTLEYNYELMYPMMDRPDHLDHDLFPYYTDDPRMLLCTVNFTLNLLISLYHLHSTVGFVHAKIEPSNIMYSWIDRCWKLIDYSCAMSVAESAVTPRTAGLCGYFESTIWPPSVGVFRYVAPEAKENRIFTPACDVFSLGRVILDRFEWTLNRLLGDAELRPWSQVLLTLARLMVSNDPQERPSVLTGLEIILNAHKSLSDTGFLNFKPDYIRVQAEKILKSNGISLHSLQPADCLDLMLKISPPSPELAAIGLSEREEEKESVA